MDELEQSKNNPKHYFIKKRERFAISFKVFHNKVQFKGNIVKFNKTTQKLEQKVTSDLLENVLADANKRIQVMHAVRFKSFLNFGAIIEFFENMTVSTSIDLSNNRNVHDKISIELTNTMGHLTKIIGYELEKSSEYNPSIYLDYKNSSYDFSSLDALASEILNKWNVSQNKKNTVCWKSFGALTDMHFLV